MKLKFDATLEYQLEAIPKRPKPRRQVCYFGDTPNGNREVNKYKVGIDCGGVFGGRLAALELPTYREYYV